MRHQKTIIDFKTLEKRLIFKAPCQELIAETLEEVPNVLKQVESYQKQGYYVVGYLSYEASKAFEKKFSIKTKQLLTEKFAYFTVHESYEEADFPISYDEISLDGEWKPLVSEQDYEAAIREIKARIRNGDTYQVNYTFHLENELKVESELVYNRMVVEQDASYNAYIETQDFTVISFSPELFFEKENQLLRTRPMKGTIKRGVTISQDDENKKWLAQDSKNRAENMMIVDLLRNDMSRISKVGSVKVKQLCQVEQYSTVWQMTSTIESELADNISLLDIFNALFPCGSITGAPKISTMSIINQVEYHPRGVYCGTVGICLPNGDVYFNVAIRTIQLSNQHAIYGVGGGITWYSEWQDEYQETKAKSQVLYRKQPHFTIITTGKIVNKEFLDKPLHVKRLKDSSRYFNFPFKEGDLDALLTDRIKELEKQATYRCKIELTKSGKINFTIEPLQDLPKHYLNLRLKMRKLDKSLPFLYFKTSYRKHIPDLQGDYIFYSADGHLQETRIGNLVLEIDGKLVTPPISEGILDGIYRQKLIKAQKLSEQVLTLDDLKRADKVFVCNAVRGLYEIEWSNND